MMRWLLLSLTILFAVPTAAAQSDRASDDPAAPEVVQLRRFALIVGANKGGIERVPLRFATHDARAMAEVLQDLGGLAPADTLILEDPSIEEIRDAILQISQRLQEGYSPGTRREVVFYYSGHSDEQGLLLDSRLYEYRRLRSELEALPAEVRIAILDSCASGALTRSKGGERTQPFLLDTATQVKGHAILTSSSADEAAQESDRLGGSFFTHYLLSGLRGAADVTRDGKVTLSEVYQFAYAETLQRTEKTQGGAQHPAYDFRLTGSGDLVLTDLRATDATLAVGSGVQGKIFVRDRNGRLVVELNKAAGHEVNLGLGEGPYWVTVQEGPDVRAAKVQVTAGASVVLARHQLQAVATEPTVVRGGRLEPPEPPGLNPSRVIVPDEREPAWGKSLNTDPRIGFMVTWIGAGSSRGTQAIHGFHFGVLTSRAPRLDGMALAPFANQVDGSGRGLQMSLGPNISKTRFHGAQFSPHANLARGSMRGLQYSIWYNQAERMQGVQLGIVNVTEDLQGTQLGVINIARRGRGAQLGVINVAQDLKGTSLGVLPINLRARFHIDFWTAESSYLNLGVKYGGRRLHVLLPSGLHPREGYPLRFSYGGGVGVHNPIGRVLFIDLDAIVSQVHFRPGDSFKARIHSQLRLVIGLQFHRHFGFFGGLSANLFATAQPPPSVPDDADGNPQDAYTQLALFGGAGRTEAQGNTFVAWPGLFFGLQF
jgi:hypothetical protein